METETLRTFRKDELGLTQGDLAERLGIDRTTVARWERGEAAIPPYLELALRQLKTDLENDQSEETEA